MATFNPIPLELPTPDPAGIDMSAELKGHIRSLYTRLTNWTHQVSMAYGSTFDALRFGLTLTPAPDGSTKTFTAAAAIRSVNGQPQALLIEGTTALAASAWTLASDGVTVTVQTAPASGTPFYFAVAVVQ